MMNVTLICVGNLKEKYFKDACAEYTKRLGMGKGGYFRARKGDDRRTGTESNFGISR